MTYGLTRNCCTRKARTKAAATMTATSMIQREVRLTRFFDRVGLSPLEKDSDSETEPGSGSVAWPTPSDALLFDARFLAEFSAKVVQLGPGDIAHGSDFDLLDLG